MDPGSSTHLFLSKSLKLALMESKYENKPQGHNSDEGIFAVVTIASFLPSLFVKINPIFGRGFFLPIVQLFYLGNLYNISD